jgi:EAL domain-containing protein (putative c-di-GMP-specific phosphodiesterase class I)
MAIVNLAHNLGLGIVAEGIETESQREFLRLLKCDEGQGYLFGRPARAELLDWSNFEPTRKQNVYGTSSPLQSSRRAMN